MGGWYFFGRIGDMGISFCMCCFLHFLPYRSLRMREWWMFGILPLKGERERRGVGKARVGILVFLELLMIERWIMW